MKIKELYNKNKSVLSFEIFPPKHGEALKNIDETLKILCELEPAFISVTCGAGGSGNNELTLEIAKKIRNNYDTTPVVHLTSINYDKEEINGMLDKFRENGIENVLALRGDKNPNIAEKDDFKYASDLTKFIKEKGGFSISGACYPETHIEAKSQKEDMDNLKTKVDNGTEVLISQLFFDNNFFYDFLKRCNTEGIDVPIVAGIMPVVNKAQIERMVNLCGASLPYKFRKILDKYEDKPEALFDAGIVYATNQVVDLLANDVDGIHIFTMNNPLVAKRITEGIKQLI